MVHFASNLSPLFPSADKTFDTFIQFSIGDAPIQLRKEIIEYMKDHGTATWFL